MARSAKEEVAQLAATLGLESMEVGTLETIRAGTLVLDGAAQEAPIPTPSLPPLDVSRRDADRPDAARSDIEMRGMLGRGGMGEVWLAHQRALDREVAIKTLPAQPFSASAAGALLVEALATGALEHPNIVPVHVLGVGPDGAPLLVMKRIEGTTLETLIQMPDHREWPALQRRHGDRLVAMVEILMCVADALHFAHTRGLVHRDVKPENIMVGPFGETYLLDWGVAHRLDSEDAPQGIVGTPAYMAPELARGATAEVDARTDVYLLGATLHAVLTGKPPHGNLPLTAALISAMESLPVDFPADAPVHLAELANQAMSAEKGARPKDAQAFRDALADFLRHRTSLRLAAEADQALQTLGDDPRPEALCGSDATRTLAEARFGFTHALREWSGNQVAARGLQRTLRLLVRAELARESPESAAALAAELTEPDPDLERQIRTLRGRVEEQRALAERARRRAFDEDPTYRGRYRVLLASGIFLVAVFAIVTSLVLTERGGQEPPAWFPALVDGIVFAGVGVAAFVFRRALLGNRFGRQAVALVLVGAALGVVVAAVTMIQGGDIVTGSPYRTLAYCGIFASGAVCISRALWVPAVWGGLAAILMSLWPSLSMPGTTSTILIAVAGLVWISVRGSPTAPLPAAEDDAR